MLDIKILGPGCANCQRLEALTRQCVADLALPATLEKVTDLEAILSYDVLTTPALVINGKVVSAGRMPAPGSITGWLREAAAAG